ncbi:MAG: hypothetical protein HZA31_13060 [Opitutae bacterium]|nr:hypothetical protein [Opitutae bacterium]
MSNLHGQQPAQGEWRIAPFRFDVTVPLGHSLCGGWIKPATVIDDPLEAIGYVLLGAGAPIVVCAVDWLALLSEAHLKWRQALAAAAGTTPDRVAVQTVHQHNAPFVCFGTQAEAAKHADLPAVFDVQFFETCLGRAREAIVAALKQPRRITHIAHGATKIEGVASNRRVFRDAAGKVLTMRGSSCKDPQLRALPEGLIDPMLKTVAFYDGAEKVVACHYYATHPMSYYADGRVNSDFCGMARKRRQKDEPGCTHMYFTGCAGNLSAGKYNDGTPESRVALTEKMYRGIVASEAALVPVPIRDVTWSTTEMLPKPHRSLNAAELEAQIANPQRSLVDRLLPAFRLAWVKRQAQGMPIPLSALHVNEVSMLHLPAELFIEYQLRAQQMRPDRVVAVAAYGDDGPWYVPVKEEYPGGGYEVSVAFCDEEVDPMLTDAIRRLLA